MDSNIKSVVSMLASDKKTTLFTVTGEVIDMSVDGPYDTAQIIQYMTPKLTGTSAVDIDLSDFLLNVSRLNLEDLSTAGIIMTHVVDGKTVQGVFYPIVTSVQVVVGDDKVVIPNVENLQAHMARAAQDQSPSVANFFKRLAPIIQARKHSGEDLMKFIKKSEMPLTNTGRIIAYKRVTSDEGEYFKDSHSGKIKQRVGSRVTMPVDMVDPSRHNSCSTGLHVANLGYLGGFSGDKTIIVLVDPENFIAVPSGEDTKARVCSYDIVGVMAASQHKTVCQGSHVENDISFEELIKAAVEGRTITPFEEILVGNKEITRVDLLAPPPPTKPVLSKKPTTGKSLSSTPSPEEVKKMPTAVTKELLDTARKSKNSEDNSETLGVPIEVYDAFVRIMNDEPKAQIARSLDTSTRSIGRWMEKYDYEDFVKRFTNRPPASSAHVEDMKAAGHTLSEIAQEMFKRNDIAALHYFKKAKKKSWSALGFTDVEIAKMEGQI